MSSYLESFDRASSSDICHHGVKGMKWGVRNAAETKPRPNNTAAEVPTKTVEKIQTSEPEKTKASAKKIVGMIAGGLGIAAIIGGGILAGKVAYGMHKFKNEGIEAPTWDDETNEFYDRIFKNKR